MVRIVVGVMLFAGSVVAGAQTVTLEIRPHIGDTLHLRYDQRIEASDGAAGPMVSTLLVMSRTIIEASDKKGPMSWRSRIRWTWRPSRPSPPGSC
jgi:hypothetical protein